MSLLRTGGSSLAGRLVRVFLLRALAISVAVVVGVWAAAQVVEGMLVEEALDGEAAHYWARYAQDPLTPRPDTLNMLGYLAHPEHGDAVPAWLADLQPGFRRVERADGHTPLVHVSERGGARLYLVFDEIQVSRLAFFFGIAPLSAVLLLIYALTWIGYRVSRAAVSPVVQLASSVERFDVAEGDLKSLDLRVPAPPGSEVRVLSDALSKFVDRLDAFVQRERDFTRNASHELRTPLAVMRANLDALERRAPEQADLERPLARMRRTVGDMEKLLETLLVLAREDESRLPHTAVVLNDLLAERLEQVGRAVGRPGVKLRLEADCLLEVQAPQKVLSIVFDNLLRNAVSYTREGSVTVIVDADGAAVRDTGPGMDAETLRHAFEPFRRGEEGAHGYGLGLAIVKRMCERFGWRLTLDSAPGQGTVARVGFPQAKVIARRGPDQPSPADSR